MRHILEFSNPKVVKKYIQSGQPLDIIDETTDNTLFMYVCDQILNSQHYKPWANLAMKMLDFTPEQINLKHVNRDGVTALLLLCGVDVDVSIKMIGYGPEAINVNSIERDNKMNALMYACTEDTAEVALALLDFPEIVTSLQNINKNGYTPLMIACEEGLEEIALTMLERFPSASLNLFQKNNLGQTAFDIAIEHERLVNVYRLINELMDEQQTIDNVTILEKDRLMTWAHKEMPSLPSFPEQLVELNGMGYDPIWLEDRNIKEYLEEDKDNILIVYEGKIYLVSRSTIERQWEDAIVFECLQADGIKNNPNIVQNLPLFNIKAIGIDIPQDKTGIWPEFIYLVGMKEILESQEQLFSVLPLVDVMLVSVISLHEAKKIGTALGSAYGSLHCQNGQGGMAGVIIPTKVNPTMTAGKKRITKKKIIQKRLKRTTYQKRRKNK
jgi:hypothetical protein